ncbi:hypothetical protein F5I97DRAFT_1926801 [Phlebopus sp. FC_14]|nr:hypothetical protein F5I97DRAFT_1926801 [Phlebopus sp. FC_14]
MVSTLANTLGMEYIGFTLAMWLFGVNSAQAFAYFQTYSDPLFLKLTVIAVVILDSANTALMCWGLYLQIIPNLGKSTLNLPLVVETMAIVLNAFIVECFLSQSIFRISQKNKVLTASIIILAVVQLAFALAACVQAIFFLRFPDYHSGATIVIGTLSVGLAVLTDLVITASLVFYFIRGRSSIGPGSDVLSKLIVYALQRTVMITVPQILLVIFFLVMPDTSVWYIFQFVEGQGA